MLGFCRLLICSIVVIDVFSSFANVRVVGLFSFMAWWIIAFPDESLHISDIVVGVFSCVVFVYVGVMCVSFISLFLELIVFVSIIVNMFSFLLC